MGFLTITLDDPAGPPGKDAVGENVVEDLVALALPSGSASGRRMRSRPSAASTCWSSARGRAAYFARSRHAVSDLRPRRRHEMVEHPRCGVLLGGVERDQRASRWSSTIAGAAELARACERGDGASPPRALLPEALQHELQVRRLDPARRCRQPRTDRPVDRPTATCRAPPRRAPARSRRAVLGGELVPARRAGRGSRRGRVRSRWSSRSWLANRFGIRALKTSSCASASSRSESSMFDAQPRPARARAARVELLARRAVVEEVLLELVEDRGRRAPSTLHGVGKRSGRDVRPLDPDSSAQSPSAARDRIAAHERTRRRLAPPSARFPLELAQCATPARRSELLPTPLAPVEDREPRRPAGSPRSPRARARARRRAARRARCRSNGARPLNGDAGEVPRCHAARLRSRA